MAADSTGYLHISDDGVVYYSSPQDIGAFQFLVDGAMVDSTFGGLSEEFNFEIIQNENFVNASNSGTVIPAGCGTLIELDLNGDLEGLSEIVVIDFIDGGVNDFNHQY